MGGIMTVTYCKKTNEEISRSFYEVEGDYDVMDEIAKCLAKQFLKERENVKNDE